MEEFIKDKKKIGICAVVIIAVIFCGIKYFTSGFKELKKNDTESIFVEDESEDIQQLEIENKSYSSKSGNSSSGDEEVFKANSRTKSITVEIKGEVNKPDVYTLEENSIIRDLIEKAGGLTAQADLSNINRAKKLQDHELIYIGNKDENNTSTAVQSAGGSVGTNAGSGNSNSMQSSSEKININTASVEELKKINGIGDSKANSIISYREQNGGFSSIEDLKNVDGIGEKMFEKMKEQVDV